LGVAAVVLPDEGAERSFRRRRSWFWRRLGLGDIPDVLSRQGEPACRHGVREMRRNPGADDRDYVAFLSQQPGQGHPVRRDIVPGCHAPDGWQPVTEPLCAPDAAERGCP
jgi:hypothetical protein